MADVQDALIQVEVVYALPQPQTVICIGTPKGSTVWDAVMRSGIAARHPEIDMATAAIGIFGKRVTLATVLREHDRIEIYRPLLADPKQVRRKRARRVAEVKPGS